MFKEIDEFFKSKSGLSQKELFQINKDLDKLEWSNLKREISNEDYLKKVSLKNKKVLRNIMSFEKNVKKFSDALNYIFPKEEAKNKLNHELKHAKICERYNIDYFFGIIRFNNLTWGNGIPLRTIWAFVYPSDNDLTLLKPRERILFNIELNEAPDNMSSGDHQGAYFWRERLKEFDSKNTSQLRSDYIPDTSEESQHLEQSPSENEDNSNSSS